MTATPLERARAIAQDVLTELCRRMELPVTITTEAADDEIHVQLRSGSEDAARLLGRDAYLLDALQHLAQAAIRRGASWRAKRLMSPTSCAAPAGPSPSAR